RHGRTFRRLPGRVLADDEVVLVQVVDRLLLLAHREPGIFEGRPGRVRGLPDDVRDRDVARALGDVERDRRADARVGAGRRALVDDGADGIGRVDVVPHDVESRTFERALRGRVRLAADVRDSQLLGA